MASFGLRYVSLHPLAQKPYDFTFVHPYATFPQTMPLRALQRKHDVFRDASHCFLFNRTHTRFSMHAPFPPFPPTKLGPHAQQQTPPGGKRLPKPGQPGGAVPGRCEVQRYAPYETVSRHGAALWRGEDRGRACTPVRHTQVRCARIF